MRTAIVLSLAFAAYAAAVPVHEEQTNFEYPRFIQFPDGDGVPHTVDLQEEVDQNVLEDVQRNPANNLYLLYTRRNPTSSQTLVINDANSVRNSNFNPSHPTVVVVHGWLSNQNTDLNPIIRDGLDEASAGLLLYVKHWLPALAGIERRPIFQASEPALASSKPGFLLNRVTISLPWERRNHVIILDWRRLAISGYITAVNGVPAVGRGLGQFLRFVHQTTGAPYNSMHLVGFSLGAHLVGNAGRELGGAVARVTGLDPAGPLWNYNSDRLSPNDGIYVEAIHTDGGYTIGGLGIGTAVANADFFPNGGISQPACLTNICNHNRAWELFAATVSYNHLVGQECSSNLQITLNTCRGQNLHMGNDNLRKWGTGQYRLDTQRRYPF